jgi:hypothetical protein
MKLVIKPSDVLRAKIVEPGWYPAVITDVVDSVAGTDQSANCTVHFQILDGKFKDVPVSRLFNEKAPGFAIGLIEALTKAKVSETEETAVSLDKDIIGRKVMLEVKNDMYKNQMQNKVTEFRAI